MKSNITADQQAAQPGVGWLGRALIVWYLFAVFTIFSLHVGDLRVTCFYAFPAAVAMFVRNVSRVRRNEVGLLALALSVALLSVFAGIDADFVGERFLSFVNISYAFFMAYALRLELGRATREDISWVSGWLTFFVVSVATLEVRGPLKPISDAFRGWNNPASFVVYSADARDMTIAGFIRPSVFTSEPSYAAVSLAVFSFVWFVSTRSPYRILMFGVATAAGLFFFRSPIAGIAIPAAGLVLLTGAVRRYSQTRHSAHIVLPIIGVILSLALMWLALDSILNSRRRSGGLRGDESLVLRLVAPPRIAAAVSQESPLMGAGLGGRGAILPQINDVFDQLGLRVVIAQTLNLNESRLPNAFWEHWIYLGLLGGVVAGYAIVRYFRLLCPVGFVPPAVFVFLLANSVGAYTIPRLWSFATLVLIACATSYESEAVSSVSPNGPPKSSIRSKSLTGRSKAA